MVLMVEIRKAEEADFRGFLECELRVWESLRDVLPTRWVENEIERIHQREVNVFRNVITDPGRITLVAEEDGVIAGFAIGRTDKSGLGWLSFMGVSPTCRRKGIGRALVRRFLEESSVKGVKKVSLNTAPGLRAAIKLYVDMGFIPEGLMRRHRYDVDLIIYSKFLD